MESKLNGEDPDPDLLIKDQLISIRTPSTNLSRVDKLLIETNQEYSRIVIALSRIIKAHSIGSESIDSLRESLVKWCESVNLIQAKRADELANNLNKQRNAFLPYYDERCILELANAISEFVFETCKLRSKMHLFVNNNLNKQIATATTAAAIKNEDLKFDDLKISS